MITPTAARMIISTAENARYHDYHYADNDMEQLDNLIEQLVKLRDTLKRRKKVNENSTTKYSQ